MSYKWIGVGLVWVSEMLPGESILSIENLKRLFGCLLNITCFWTSGYEFYQDCDNDNAQIFSVQFFLLDFKHMSLFIQVFSSSFYWKQFLKSYAELYFFNIVVLAEQ